MNNDLRFSIVVLTFAREAILADTLDRLAGHLEGRTDYELLLVDNNPEDFSRSAQLARFNLAKVIWDGRNKGVAARNLGFDMARGDYVILDAEMIRHLPPKVLAATGVDALAHVVECFTSN